MQYVLLTIAGGLLAGHFGALVMHRFRNFLRPDEPNERSSHSSPTPRGGGIGFAMFGSLASFIILPYPLLSIAILSIILLGIADDRWQLSSTLRLLSQLFIAFVAFIALKPLIIYHLSANYPINNNLNTISICILIFCVIFITSTLNFYNFMDGINGLATVTSIIAMGWIAFFATINNEFGWALFSLSILASCVGFLPHNFPSARIFMGDGGSTMLGFTFACCCLALCHNIADFLFLVTLSSTFYADTFSTLVIRLLNKNNIFEAHREHLYQLLVNELKMQHWQVTLGYAVIQLVTGYLAFQSLSMGTIWQWALILIWGIIFILLKYRIQIKIASLR